VKTSFIALVLAAAACGGAGNRKSERAEQAGPADVPAMRVLLERFSPTGTWIVRTNDTLPTQFVFGPRSLSLTYSGDFASYFDDGAPEHVVDYMSTSVHEVYHAVSDRLGYQLLVDARATEPVDCEGLYVGDTPLLVRYSATYPAREMDASFPADARTNRYATYVSPSADTQSTQQEGVFGLLDEWTAYLHDGRTILDFWPWVRDEAPPTRAVYVKYRSRFNGVWEPHAEFQLYILHYLVHARDQRPDVYRALMANESFRRAFAAADKAWTELLAAASALEPAVVAIAEQRGAGTTTFHGDANYPALLARLETEPYRSLLAELRGSR
jgi:hypothetical protein